MLVDRALMRTGHTSAASAALVDTFCHRAAGAKGLLNTARCWLLSVVDLQAAINRYLDEHNGRPKPFVWTTDPDRIIVKVNRWHQALASDHYTCAIQPLKVERSSPRARGAAPE